jgi:polyisoprenoid-binding protein YceI
MTQVSTAGSQQTQTAIGSYEIDRRSSRFTVQAFAAGLLSAMAHNPTLAMGDFSGKVRFNPDTLEARGFRLAINASSLSVQDDVSSSDRREIERLVNEEVLETEKFPEILYEASNITVVRTTEMTCSATLDGELTLHGVTRPQSIVARVTLLGSMLRVSGEFSLDQTDFNIRLISVAGGALKVKDELKFSFEIVARSHS